MTCPNDAAGHQPLVVMMCGVAGSGKTTYAKRLELGGYTRLSVDEEVWARFGRYGADYPAEDYPRLSALAEEILRGRLLELIGQGHDVVVDLSFWQRATREEYKCLVTDAGARWRLVYLQVDVGVLRRRLAQRAQRIDANAAFTITDDVLAAYLEGFEVPDGEGEEVLRIGADGRPHH